MGLSKIELQFGNQPEKSDNGYLLDGYFFQGNESKKSQDNSEGGRKKKG